MDKKFLFLFLFIYNLFLCRKNVMKAVMNIERKILNNIDELSITDLENAIKEKNTKRT